MIQFTPLLVLALATLAVPATASPSDRRFAASEARDARQEQRIATGIARGTINPREASRLQARNGRIDNFQNRLASDGRYSRRDRARVAYRQNSASHGIYRARHNRR
ncbi:hypothetical protein [Sandarakinorhabdus sp. DWP1-3-1]|uniref:hypothetical protein n=1 Tax=Sandarakinorhabdus sp. DWP1-3-1 TaxID=2804627 RepID=UPI003CFA6984